MVKENDGKQKAKVKFRQNLRAKNEDYNFFFSWHFRSVQRNHLKCTGRAE